MSRITDYLITIRRILKCQESLLKEISEEYHLTLTEATIISFLHNNPGRDTAADIVELRMLSKGHVSQAVESLIQKSLLHRRQDTADRRKIHLFLTPAAQPIVRAIDRRWEGLHQIIFRGLSQEDQQSLVRINRQMMDNLQNAITEVEKG